MIYPSIDSMLKQVENRYILAMLSVQRAIQLLKGEQETIEATSKKPIIVALEEIAEGKIKYHLK